MKVYCVYEESGNYCEESYVTLEGVYSNKSAAIDHAENSIKRYKKSTIKELTENIRIFGTEDSDIHGRLYVDCLERAKNFACDSEALLDHRVDISDICGEHFDYSYIWIEEREVYDEFISEDN